MAVKMNLWSLTLIPGERYPLFVRRDFQITNVALGEELKSADGRSVIKVTHNPIPANALESDSEYDSEFDSEFDDEEIDDEEDDEEEDEDEEDEEPAAESKASKKLEEIKNIVEDADMDGDDDDEEDDEDFSDDESDIEIEETNVIASLTAGRTEQATVNLTFVEGDVVIFETTGENAVHLLGNYIDQFPDVPSDSESDYDSEFSGSDDYSDLYGSDDDDIELDTEEEEAVAKITEIPTEKPAKKAAAAEEKPKKAALAASDAKPAQKRKADDIDSPAKTAPAAAAAADTEGLSKNQKKKMAKKAKLEAETPAPAVKKEEKKVPSKRTLDSGLIIEDVKVGEGQVAKTGKRLGMRYVGKLTTGKQFDANTSGKPFSFVLGKGEVIKGWDQGLAGMAVGGERRLTIPANLAYGSQKIPGIPKNSTLKFDVKLVSIN
ncbi:uncharacterized protein I303_106962 [Kwoniella dejecticola CBS 10117]|uniref:FK506-binding protein n=1 Tax=Kwoniella dejecticola CBS 10117 TaxID=1296121 RepID=A0A1A5ZYB6_9TREE|nr:FK506-binding protein 4 [Kwoniella dejecticola CBS 10117]OBR82806.1 FK506-binding protein 4 [Kwoniella dejecticola CBS 10117]